MARSTAERDVTGTRGGALVDPRGAIRDDAASPGQRSLLAIAGSLLVEISLPKLLFAWTVSLLLPALLLGVAPLVATAWFSSVSRRVVELTEIGATLVLVAVIAVGWLGWRPLFRIAETNFWSLNALAVQPGYAFGREALRHLAELISAGTAARRDERGCVRRPRPARALCCACVGLGSRPSFGRLRAGSVLCRSGAPAPPDRSHACECRRRDGVLSWRRLAGLGHRRCDHGPAPRSGGFDDVASSAGNGAWPTSPTFMWLVSVMASGSRAAAPGRAATNASPRPVTTWGDPC